MEIKEGGKGLIGKKLEINSGGLVTSLRNSNDGHVYFGNSNYQPTSPVDFNNVFNMLI